MNLSPLRKQVESLNKDLESQNIQIKDLIRFLNKSTPNNTTPSYQSPRSNLKNLLQLKGCFSEDKMLSTVNQKKPPLKLLRQTKSMKYLKPFQPIKSTHEIGLRHATQRQLPMTKSVTFHNIHNALTTRKYLKLSRPEKKINSSCSFCRENTFGSSTIQDCSKINKVASRIQIQPKLTESKNIWEKSESRMKKSRQSRSKHKLKQKPFSGKKTPLKQLGQNEVLSKHEVKSFIEKKSLMRIKEQKSNARLQLKVENKYKNSKGVKK